MNLLKKENLGQKSFLSNVKWSSKKLQKMISADTKNVVKQEVKELVAPSRLILSVKNRGVGWKGFYLTTKIFYAWQKLFINDHLVAGCFH